MGDGKHGHPEKFFAEFIRAKFPDVNKPAFRAQFQLIKDITTRYWRHLTTLTYAIRASSP